MPEPHPEIEGLRAALAVSPDNTVLRGLLGEALLKYGYPKEAAQELEQALRKERDSWPLKVRLARAYHQCGRGGEALMVLSGLERDPAQAPEGVGIYCRLLAQEGRLADAAKFYAKAVAGDGKLRDLGLEEELYPFYQPGMETDDEEGGQAEKAAPQSAWGGGFPGDPGSGGLGDSDGEGDDLDGIFGDRVAMPVGGLPRDVASPLERPDVNFADVGGMEGVKEEIRMKIILPLQHPELFKAYGKKAGGGILLYGPPGCGKTHIARCTAGEVGANFMAIGINDVLDMWIGSSEKNLHQIFEQARRMRPCVLFFDEVDALGASRTDMRQSAGRTTINQFLSELDGVEQSNEGVLVLAATNAPWHLDSAFRRPGRFDRIIFVPPSDQPGREQILRVLLKGKPSEDVDFGKLAKQSEGFSGADLQATVELAVEALLQQAMKTGQVTPLRTGDLLGAMKKQRPTTREWFSTAKNYAMYANQGGHYDDILEYLRIKR